MLQIAIFASQAAGNHTDLIVQQRAPVNRKKGHISQPAGILKQYEPRAENGKSKRSHVYLLEEFSCPLTKMVDPGKTKQSAFVKETTL